MPENDLIKLSKEQDYISFYEKEIENRKLFNYPPFTQMVKITFSSKEENSAKNEAISFKNKLIKFLQKNIITTINRAIKKSIIISLLLNFILSSQ